MEKRTASPVAWIALVLAAISLVLSVIAVSRSGVGVRSEIQKQAMEIREDISRGLALGESRTRLETLEQQIAAGEGYEQARQEVSEIRGNLNSVFSDSKDELRQEWQQLDAELGQLENSLRDGSGDALERLQGVLERLQRKVEE
jgi:uncharacterized phage infection (PIP) family protein YhgE